MIKEALKRLSYAVFPRRCDLCGEIVCLDENICCQCRLNERIEGEICTFCGHLVADCSCRKKKMEYKSVTAPFYFKDNIVKAVHRFKFSGYKELADAMGLEIAKCVKLRYKDINFDCITFVPLTKKKLRKRGYNQSFLLADRVSELLNIPCETLLIKVFENKSQRSQSAKERKLNVFGAFDLCDNTDVSGKTILIIDDVKTTGSTLNECAKVLKGYGAKAVYAAAFAITKNNKKENADSKNKKY